MEYIKIVCGILGGIAVLTPNAYANLTKCVKLSESSGCSLSGGSANYGTASWSGTCGVIKTEGIAYCSSQSGASVGATSGSLSVSVTDSDNKYCWCKMVIPGVSLWIYSTAYLAGTGCYSDCPDSCASNTSVHSKMLQSTLS